MIELKAISRERGDDPQRALEQALAQIADRDYAAELHNHDGRYYALHEFDRYDRHGLWSCGDIHFSIVRGQGVAAAVRPRRAQAA